jgi:hypothetical protein
MKASTRPGSVAWLTASLTSERLRKYTNVPIAPALAPSNAAPMHTSAAL